MALTRTDNMTVNNHWSFLGQRKSQLTNFKPKRGLCTSSSLIIFQRTEMTAGNTSAFAGYVTNIPGVTLPLLTTEHTNVKIYYIILQHADARDGSTRAGSEKTVRRCTRHLFIQHVRTLTLIEDSH